MPDKTVLLLDVDGVINACPSKPVGTPYPAPFPTIWPEDSWRFEWVGNSAGKFPIHWNTNVVDFLNEISSNIEIRWHTTWLFEALDLAKIVGLKDFPVQENPHMVQKMYGQSNESTHLWWKMQSALDVVNVEKRPLIWVDDDLGMHNRVEFKESVTNPDAWVAFLSPYTDTGLRPSELEQINRWALPKELSDLDAN